MINMVHFWMIAKDVTVIPTFPVSNQRQNFYFLFRDFSAPGLCCHRRLGAVFSEGRGRRSDDLYSVSRSLDNIVFPSVIPYRRFASDEATPLTNDPRWLY